MNIAVRTGLVVALGFVLVVLQATLHRATGLLLIGDHALTPMLFLPLVIFLGVSPEVHLLRGALIAFFIGYLVDLYTSHPMSAHTFLTMATYLIARGARLRLFMRGPMFQVALTFVAAALFGAATLGLRAVFEAEAPFPVAYGTSRMLRILFTSLATAAVAPFVFAVAQRIDEPTGTQGRGEATGW